MRIPRTVKLGNHEFKVIYKKTIRHPGKNGEECYGLCDYDSHVIYLQRGMHPSKKSEVFFHECLHAIDELFDLRLGEKKVNLLAVTVMAWIKNNRIDFGVINAKRKPRRNRAHTKKRRSKRKRN